MYMAKKLKPFERKDGLPPQKKKKFTEPTEIIKIDEFPNEQIYHRKALLIWMQLRDREKSSSDACEETAELVGKTPSTIKGWCSKYKWNDRYDKDIANVFLLAAAARQPEIRKQANSILSALITARIDLDLRTEQYYYELKKWKKQMEIYSAMSEDDQLEASIPERPKSVFEIRDLGDLNKYQDILDKFIGEKEKDEKPDVTTLTIRELKAIVQMTPNPPQISNESDDQ